MLDGPAHKQPCRPFVTANSAHKLPTKRALGPSRDTLRVIWIEACTHDVIFPNVI